MVRPFTHDTYAPLSFVEGLGEGDGQTLPPLMATSGWLEYDDARRLASYRILAAMRDNAFRYLLPEKLWQRDGRPQGVSELERIRHYLAQLDELPPAQKWREYGDAMLLVQQGRSLMLGDSQDLVLPELERLLKEEADEGRAEETREEKAAREQDSATQQQQVERLQEFDGWLQDWSDSERLRLALVEGEENTVGDGDGVYTLGWNDRLGRPRLRVYDPGWYFPDLDTIGDDDEFPTVVHVAWDYERRTDGHTVLHRKTWRLVDIDSPEAALYQEAPAAPYDVPWSDEKATRFLVYAVAEWDTTQLQDRETVYTLLVPDTRATVLVEPTVTLVDFLPVVHVPNDASGARHFGRSLLLSVAQLLPDLQGTDSDLQANSEFVGSSPLVTKGNAGALDAGPGAQWNMGDGDAKFLDTSRALLGLTGYSEHLLSRLSTNSRLAESLLGRVSPKDVPSGYALELGFAPTRSLVREMRMVRDEKYPLIMKFAMRLAQLNDVLPDGETPRAVVALGGYLPADRAAAVQQVAVGLKEHAFSHSTGVQILIDAGFPIEDAEAEVEQIRAEAFEDMVRLVDALGADGVIRVREWLGMDQLAPGIPALQPAPTPPAGAAGAGQ